MATQFDPIAKDESLNTTESPSRNIADVLAEELSAIEQAIAGGSGSGGHTIVNASGTDMTQRAKMQFVDAEVTDDAVNDVTKISTTPASYPSANVTYGSGTVEDALDDISKHAFGQDVDLASYSTSSNKFTVPNDGYIYVVSTDLTGSSPAYRLDVWCGNFVLCSLSKNIQRITTFVRKGMQIYYTNYYYSVGTNCFIQYTPLV